MLYCQNESWGICSLNRLLRSVDADENRFRFYRVALEVSISGDLHLIKQWGRLGLWMRERRCPIAAGSALAKADKLVQDKIDRGYVECSPDDLEPDIGESRLQMARRQSKRIRRAEKQINVIVLPQRVPGYPCRPGDLFWRSSGEVSDASPCEGNITIPFRRRRRDWTKPDAVPLGAFLHHDQVLLNLNRLLFREGILTVGDFIRAPVGVLIWALGDIEAVNRVQTALQASEVSNKPLSNAN